MKESLTRLSRQGLTHSLLLARLLGSGLGPAIVQPALAILCMGMLPTAAYAQSAPTVANPIPDQAATTGTAFSFTLPAGTFSDADNDSLTYTAQQTDGTTDSELPTWLSFTAGTGVFSGTPTSTDTGTLMVKVTASDGTDSVSDTFDIVVSAPLPTLSIAVVEKSGVAETANFISVNEEVGTFEFTVTLSAASTGTVTVRYATEDIPGDAQVFTDVAASFPATAGEDYTAASGMLVFVPGETSKTVSVRIIDETLYEQSQELFRIVLSNPSGATIAVSQGQLLIGLVEADPLPPVSVMAAGLASTGSPGAAASTPEGKLSVAEGDSGETDITFTVTQSRVISWQSVQVGSFRTPVGITGTATANTDFEVTAETLNFAAGTTQAEYTLKIKGDTDAEGDETLYVLLGRGNGIVTNSGEETFLIEITIVDDDGVPSKPRAPRLTASASGQLTVNWAAPADDGGQPIDDYDVRYRVKPTSGDPAWTEEASSTADSTATTRVITGLTDGTAYQVQVRAENENGDGAWSDTTEATPVASPSTSPTAEYNPGSGALVIRNAPLRAIDATFINRFNAQFHVVEITISNGSFGGRTASSLTLMVGSARKVYSAGGTDAGERSWRAVDAQEVTEGSATISTKIPGASITAASSISEIGFQSFVQPFTGRNLNISSFPITLLQTAPDAPENLTLALRPQMATLSWSNPRDSSITGYQYRVGTSGVWTNLPGSSATTTSFDVFDGLTGGSPQTVQLRAVNANGNGASASVTSAVPAAPTGLTAVALSASARLGWADPDDPSIIKYQFRIGTSGTWTDIAGSSAASVTGIASGLTNGSAQDVFLRAVNLAGASAASSSVSVTPVANRAPTLVQTHLDSLTPLTVPVIPALTRLGTPHPRAGIYEVVEIDLYELFNDEDNEPVFTATGTTSDARVVTVRQSPGRGRYLTLYGQSRGSATVTVKVTDQFGAMSPVATIMVTTENQPPRLVAEVDDVHLVRSGTSYTSQTLDLSRVFRDMDGDSLTYTAKLLDDTAEQIATLEAKIAKLTRLGRVAETIILQLALQDLKSGSAPNTITVSLSGAIVTLGATGPGVVDVIVTASDGQGGSASDTFDLFAPDPDIAEAEGRLRCGSEQDLLEVVEGGTMTCLVRYDQAHSIYVVPASGTAGTNLDFPGSDAECRGAGADIYIEGANFEKGSGDACTLSRTADGEGSDGLSLTVHAPVNGRADGERAFQVEIRSSDGATVLAPSPAIMIIDPGLSYEVPGSLQVKIPARVLPTRVGFSNPISYAVTTGTLPPGLVIDATTGVISGTPTTANASTVTVTVTATAGTGSTLQTATADVVLPAVEAAATVAALVLSETSLTVDEGTSDTYTLRLATEPTGNVTVAVAVAGSADVTVAVAGAGSALTVGPASLRFTRSNWNIVQTVAVRAAEDTDMVDDTATLNHTASGGGYDSLTGSVAVTVDDDDAPTLPTLSYPAAPSSLALDTVITSLTPTVSGFDDTVSYAVTTGTLPPGLGIDATTGVISGTPTTVNASGVTVTVTATAGTGTTMQTATADIAFPAVGKGTLTMPTGLGVKANSKTRNGFTITWTAVANATGYTATARASGQPDKTVTLSTAPTNPEAVFTGLAMETTYTVTVIATGNANYDNSPASNGQSVTTLANSAPTVANPIPDQAAPVGVAFSYPFPANSFNDTDSDSLTYTAMQTDGTTDSALPSWLSFTPATRLFSGTPQSTDTGTLSVKVTANDGTASVSDTFDIVVSVMEVEGNKLATPTVTLIVGDTWLRATWPESANFGSVDSSELQWKASSVTGWSGAGVTTVTGTSAKRTGTDITGLTTGTAYEVRVRYKAVANNSESLVDSDWSSAVTATPKGIPAPTDFMVRTAGDTEVILSWTAPEDNRFTGYEVNRDDGGWEQLDASRRSTDARLTGLTNEQTYSFQLRAVRAMNRTILDGTQEVVVEVLGAAKILGAATPSVSGTPGRRPGMPGTVTAEPSDGQVKLTWEAPSSGGTPTGYEVSSDNGQTWTATGSTNLSYTVTSLTNGQSYNFEVRGVNAIGAGSPSGVSATPRGVPAAPTGLAAAPGNGEVKLTWTPHPEGDTLLRLEYTRDNGTTWTAIEGDPYIKGSHVVTGLTNDQAYSFQVRAVNNVGNSAASTAVSATPTATGNVRFPAPVTGLTVTATAQRELTASWTAASHAPGGYELRWVKFGVSNSNVMKATLMATDTSRKITGLDRGTPYIVTIVTLDSSSAVVADTIVQKIAKTLDATSLSYPALPTELRAGVQFETLTPDSPTNFGTGSTFTYAVTAGTLPSGLEIDANTGAISGTPDTPKNTRTSVTVTVTGTTGTGVSQQTETATATLNFPRIFRFRLPAPTVMLAVGKTQLTANWPAVANAGTYALQWKESSVTSWTAATGVTTVDPATPGRVITGLTTGTTYDVRVRSKATPSSTTHIDGEWSSAVQGVPANSAPTVATEIPNRTETVGVAFSFTLPAGTFSDADSGDILTYTAMQTDGTTDSELPTWLSFTAGTGVFSGTPTSTDTGTLMVKVTASDGTASVSDTFNIVVNVPPALTFSKDSLTVDEGGSNTYTVALAAPPTENVTVAVTVSGSSDVTVSSASLTFTSTTWNTAQTVTVTAAQDDDAGDDTATVNHTASGGGYNSVTGSVPVTVEDGDTPALEFEPTEVVVNEGTGSSNYTVALATQPSATVTVTVGGTASTDLTVDTDSNTTGNQNTLTFTTTDWSTAQTVMVSAAEDADTVDDRVTLSHNVTGGDYGSVTGNLEVRVDDDDSPGLVFEPTALTVDEDGSDTYTVALATQPAGNVTVTVGGTTNSDVTVDTDTGTAGTQNKLTFSNSTWNTPQTVTVNAASDDDATDDSVTLTHATTGYDSVSDNLRVTVDDDDQSLTYSAAPTTLTVGIRITALTATATGFDSTPSYAVTPGSLPAGLTISASTGEITGAPTAASTSTTTVTVTATVGTGTDTQTATANITFPAVGKGTLATPTGLALKASTQSKTGFTVTWTAVENATNYTATATPSGGTAVDGTVDTTGTNPEAVFTGLAANTTYTVSVMATGNTDNYLSSAAATLSQPTSANSAPTTVANAIDDQTATVGTAFSFPLPAGTFSDADSGDSLTYTAMQTDGTTDSALPTWLSLTADTGVFSGTPTSTDTGTLSVKVTASDGTASVSNTFNIVVNVPPALTFSKDSLTVDEGDSGTYTVALAAPPTGDVTVAVTVSGSSDVTVSPASLIFTSTTWNTAQTVTVTAAPDDDAGDDTATVNHVASGGGYNSVTGSVPVTVDDANTPALEFTPTSVVVNEGVGSSEYTVALATQPSATVTVTVGGWSNTDVSVDTNDNATGNQNTLTFTTTDWRAAQTVMVSATEDADTVDDRVTLRHTVTGGDYGSVTGNLAVRVDDNDSPGLVFTPTALTVDEGGRDTYTVALATQPAGNVTVTVGTTSNDVTVDTDTGTVGAQDTLTFSNSTWNMAQTVTVSAADDADTTDDSVTLTHTTTDYNSVSDNLTVTVDDDDQSLTYSAAPTTLMVGTPITALTATATGFDSTPSYAVTPGSLPAGLTINAITGAITGTPTAASTSMTTVTVTATAGTGTDMQTATADIPFPAVGKGTLATPTGLALKANTQSKTGFTVTWDAVENATGYMATAVQGSNSFMGAVNGTEATFTGLAVNTTYTVSVVAKDNTANYNDSPAGTLRLSTAANQAPTVANMIPDQSATVDTGFSFTVPANTFSDADGDTLTYRATKADDMALPAWLTFNSDARTFSGTPTSMDIGTLMVKVTASDGNGGSISDTFNIMVSTTAANQAPTVANMIPDQSATVDTEFSFNVPANTFSDADGDTLTYRATKADNMALPAWLTFNPDARTFSGTPTSMDIGTLMVKVTASDGNGGSISDTFNIMVSTTAANQAPTVANMIPDQSATVDTEFSFNVPANTFSDADGDTLTYRATKADDMALPAWLTFNPDARTFSGTPTSTDTGTLMVKVTASDGNGGSISDTFNIMVSTTTANQEMKEKLEGVNKEITPSIVNEVVGRQMASITDRFATISSGFHMDSLSMEEVVTDVADYLFSHHQDIQANGFDWRQALSGHNFSFALADTSVSQGSMDDGEPSSSGSGPVSFWGGIDYSSLEDRIEPFSLDGDITSFNFGVDKEFTSDLVAGVLLSIANSEFELAEDSTDSTYEVDIFTVNPYISWEASDELSLWASVGYGRGQTDLTDDSTNDTFSQGGNFIRFSAGGRFQLWSSEAGTALALKLDGTTAHFLGADVQRSRLATELSHDFSIESGVLNTALELGLLMSSADESAAELVGRLHWQGDSGFSASAQSRVLLGGGDRQEWGIGGALRYTAGGDGEREGEGLVVSLEPSFGISNPKLLSELWSATRLDLAVTREAPTAQLNVKLAYGFPTSAGLLTPYTDFSFSETTNTYVTGLRYGLPTGWNLNLKGMHKTSTTDAENTILLELRSDL